jgi:hypothetical protein
MLRAAKVELEAAKERLKRIEGRDDLITKYIRGTFKYVDAKKDAARHSALVQWALEQVSFIEAEITQSAAPEAEPNGTKRAKRKLITDEANSEKGSAKKQKLEHRELGSLSRSSTADLPEARKIHARVRFAVNNERSQPRDEAQSVQTNKSIVRRSLRSADTSQVVEAELRESEAAEGGSHMGRGTKRKLGHDQEDEVTNDRRTQKRRRSGQSSSLIDGNVRSPRSARVPSEHNRRDDAADDQRPSKRLRKTHSDGHKHRPTGTKDYSQKHPIPSICDNIHETIRSWAKPTETSA